MSDLEAVQAKSRAASIGGGRPRAAHRAIGFSDISATLVKLPAGGRPPRPAAAWAHRHTGCVQTSGRPES